MNLIHQQKKFSVLLFLFVLSILPLRSGMAQTSRASSSTDSISVGELFEISIKLQYNQPYDRFIYPDSSAFPDVIEWLSTQQFRLTDFSDSLVYHLQFFAGQDITLPPFRIGLVSAGDTSFIFTNPVNLYFKSVLPSEDAELKPLKPIFSFSRIHWAWFVIIAALIAAAVWAYLTLRSKPEEQIKEVVTTEPFVSPLAELEITLKALRDDYDLAQTKDFKYFYTTISDSIRQYYEVLYNIPALESTSRELFRYLDAFGVDHEMIKTTRKVLNRSDMVKFAKFTPTLDDAWKTYQTAIDFLDRARLIDASRISRMRSEYESQFLDDVQSEESSTDKQEDA
jgi:hypothetical protein